MVSQSYRSVLEAEILRDYRLPRSASFCSRHLEATRSKACTTKPEDHGAGAAPERPTSPRKLGKKASSRRLVTKLIEVPLKVERNASDAPKERGGIDLRRIGSTRLLTASKASKQKPVKAPREDQPSGAAAEIRVEKKKEGKDDPRGTSLRRRASSKRLLKSKPSTRKIANIADIEVNKVLVPEVETAANEIAFVPPRNVRAPSSAVASIFYGSGRTKPSAAMRRSVTFTEDDNIVRVEFAYDEIEYQDFPEVPSYEHLEHDEYYVAMAEMVAELNGRAADSSRRSSHRNVEFTVCSAVEVVSTEDEFTVCFAPEPSPSGNGSTTEAADANAVPNSNNIVISTSDSQPDAQPDVGGDSSTTSDTLPLSQDDESYLPDQFRTSPRPTHGGLTDSPSSPLEAVIPRTVIYQSPETKKRRRSALSVMKRTLKIVSL